LEEEGESRTWLQIGRSGSRIAAPAWATDSRPQGLCAGVPCRGTYPCAELA
jgi:hypothetical protein